MVLSEYFVKADMTVLEAMQIIDRSGAQVGLVVDEKNQLLGLLTDGDIRRGLLHSISLETAVDGIMNTSFHSASYNDNREEVLKMMRDKGIFQCPILDDQGRVVDLILLKELLTQNKLSNAVVIMAGGRGTRLLPLTKQCPKPMLHVDGKPMLENLLNEFTGSGFCRFYISVNYMKEAIMNYFQDGSQWGVKIDYLVEEDPLGTAGSLQFLPKSIDETFIVVNADILTRLNPKRLVEFHNEHNAMGTLCVHQHTTTIPFGVVRVNGVDLDGFEEKPIYRYLANAGIYALKPEILELLKENQPTDMPTLLENAQKAGHRIVVCPIHEYWIDVGRPETLQQAHLEWPKSHTL
jgi:dTDP-glucose pyrophosphorylase/predicted transcriptional regulator